MRGSQRRARRQRHPLVAEVKALAERGAKHFLAVGLQEARGPGEGELVSVAEAVAADEAVLGEKLRIVEVGERRVEERDMVLVVIGHEDIEEPRLERLRERVAEPARIALEDQAAVEAEPRNGEGRPLRLALGLAVKLIAAVAQPGLRRHVPAGRNTRRGDGRREARARAFDQRRMDEAHELSG